MGMYKQTHPPREDEERKLPNGQRKSKFKNRTLQSTLKKYGGLTIAASSPEVLKTIRPLPGEENMSHDLRESDDSMDGFS